MILPKTPSTMTDITTHGSERMGPLLVHGWVHQCSGWGTLDIIQICLITIFLCSWSVLCFNEPEETTGRWGYLRNQIHCMLFAIVFPEVIISIGESNGKPLLSALKILPPWGTKTGRCDKPFSHI
jgi:hypothetical protein